MKKCMSCGFDNEDDAKFCATCGAVLSSDPFEPAPAPTAATDGVQSAEQPASEVADNGSGKGNGGFKAKIDSAKNKTLAFEKKHSIILNAIVAVCALVIALVALFAPIQTVQYVAVLGSGSNMSIEGMDEEADEVTYCYVEVSQSIWQMIGAIKYIKADENDIKELQTELQKAQTAMQVDLAAWILKNPNADEIEQANAMSEIIADNLSDINYLGYVMAVKGDTVIDGEDIGVAISGEYWAAVMSMAFGLIITILAIIMAIFSLVYLIFAIIGMVKKKPQQKLFKYLGLMLALSGAGLSCMFAAPMLKAGGGMFAVALFSAIAYLICGGVGALLADKEGKLVILKRSIIALIAMIAFFILTTNIFCVTLSSVEGGYEALNAPTGYGIFGMLSTIDKMIDGLGENPSAHLVLSLGSSFTGVIFYILMAGFAISYSYKAMKRSLKRLAFGEVAKSSSNAWMIASAVFMLISIIAGLALSGMITEKLALVFSENRVELDGISMEWTMRAQVWVSMIMLIIAAVFDMAFKPASKQPVQVAAEEPAPAQDVTQA
ncbi:MAG: zinc ribbon domain-containing protein [Clostridiales bacterium]|nr:zinc ribbon domain-containing protein [Clostridiales bacterium]